MLQLNSIFQDNMILQCGKPVKVFGNAEAGQVVKITIQNIKAETTADKNGRFIATIPALKVSDNEEMIIVCKEETVCIKEIAVGEVWIAAGQSNIEFYMRYETHREEEKKSSSDPLLRFYDVPEIAYDGQEKDFDYSRMGIWRKADTWENKEYFSAVGYYFGKRLRKEKNVPIGIVGLNWGGTTSQAWMSRETVATVGTEWLADYQHSSAFKDSEEWMKQEKHNPMNDRGNPFASMYHEAVMPVTPSMEETMAFFKNMDKDTMKKREERFAPEMVPSSLYEHMVLKTSPFTIRGFLWYQGESDDLPGKREIYGRMLKGIIHDWRTLWQEELPFLCVQLPGFHDWLMLRSNQFNWIRRGQTEAIADTANAWLCSTSDCGDEHDIHPKDKKTVGQRLALLAQQHVYQMPVEADAPTVVKAERCKQDIQITFANAKGLYIKGNHLSDLHVYKGNIPFEERVTDEQVNSLQEVTYEAEVKEDTLYLHGDFPNCITIAFAETGWYCVNLYNRTDIPAFPFSFIME